MKKKPEPLPKPNYIIGEKDQNQALGSGELLPCPFCGSWAFSVGEKKPSGNHVYEVICSNTPECGAGVHCCMRSLEKSRAGAVAKWNKRK